MIRISLAWVINVVRGVDALDQVVAGQTFGQAWGYIYSAHSQLEALLNQSLYSPSIVSSRTSADSLREELSKSLSRPSSDKIEDIDVWMIKHRQEEFKTILVAELATLPTFFVSAKPPYSTETLLQNGEALMPSDLASKVPEAIFDVRESAKCIAFDVGTASAFHSFRALESVVRRYYSEVAQGQSEPKQRNMGVYIRALSNAGANQKIISALTQLKDLHRNPIAHPEAAIPIDEAITIAGLVRSVIAAMLVELPIIQQTTTLNHLTS